MGKNSGDYQISLGDTVGVDMGGVLAKPFGVVLYIVEMFKYVNNLCVIYENDYTRTSS